jgi:tRNA(Arg) A34 adenosine deaminase TadA
MDEALEEARKALDKGEVPIGCSIRRNGKTLSRGHNLTNEESNPLSHAEIVALRQLKTRENLTVYVTIEPCGMCMDILNKIGCTVFYGAKNYLFGGLSVLKMEISIACHIDPRDESVDLLKMFYSHENPGAPDEMRKRKDRSTAGKRNICE